MAWRRIPVEVWDQQPFGEEVDAAIARRLGVSREAARNQRARRGIAAAKPCPDYPWDRQPFGTAPDAEIARNLGVNRTSVQRQRRRRGIDSFVQVSAISWDQQPFGEVSDGEIAERLGVTAPAVQYQRNKRGIEAYSGQSRIGDSGKRLPASTWNDQPFGKVSDREIARSLGVARSSVRAQRCSRGIPPYKRPVKK